MAFCNKCGTQLEDDAKFCPSCGETTGKADFKVEDVVANIKALNNTADTTAQYDKGDIEKNKIMAALSYVFVLFLLPIFLCPQSKFAKFHANQGIVNFCVDLALSLVIAICSFIPVVRWIVGVVGGIAGLALMVLGIYNAVMGKAKELPFVGGIRIL